MSVGPILKDYLTRSGLADLIPWASEMIINGASEDEILLDIENQPAFRSRFSMIFARHNAGHPPISVSEVLEYEARATEAAKAYGVTISQEEINALITNNVSLREAVEDRLGLAAQAVHMASPELRGELSRLYGINDGDLIRYWLDPKKEAPVLQRRFAAAQISEQALRAGYDTQLTSVQAEDLALAGVDQQAAQTGFGTLVNMDELFEGVDQTEEDIDVESQLSLLTGNAELAQTVERRAEKRTAKFQEGGSFATGQEGIAGIGSANR